MSWMTARYSSSIFLRSSAASRARRMSRIAWAWSSDSSKPRHEVRPGGVDVGRLADRLDHRVEVVEGDLEALEDVGPGARLAEVELGAPADDVAPMVDVVLRGPT